MAAMLRFWAATLQSHGLKFRWIHVCTYVCFDSSQPKASLMSYPVVVCSPPFPKRIAAWIRIASPAPVASIRSPLSGGIETSFSELTPLRVHFPLGARQPELHGMSHSTLACSQAGRSIEALHPHVMVTSRVESERSTARSLCCKLGFR